MRLHRTKHFLSLATKANIFGVKIIESRKWRESHESRITTKENTEIQSTEGEQERSGKEEEKKELNSSAKQEHHDKVSKMRERC